MNGDLICKNKQPTRLLGRGEEERTFPIDETASAKALRTRQGWAHWRSRRAAVSLELIDSRGVNERILESRRGQQLSKR